MRPARHRLADVPAGGVRVVGRQAQRGRRDRPEAHLRVQVAAELGVGEDARLTRTER